MSYPACGSRTYTENDSGKRPVGKTRGRSWVNAVDTETKEILKAGNWKRESLDRQVWRRLRAVAPCKRLEKITAELSKKQITAVLVRNLAL
jgi:hypothetical protein